MKTGLAQETSALITAHVPALPSYDVPDLPDALNPAVRYPLKDAPITEESRGVIWRPYVSPTYTAQRRRDRVMEKKHSVDNAKTEQLDEYRKQNTGKPLTYDSGTKVSNDQQTLRAGKRGPTLLQDTHFYRKQSRFNRERIPEKVVHARGFGVHGEFELQKSMRHVTKADFLQEPGTKTPVFVRLSNFIGSKGSKDTAIDVRGFATKFYTQEGNYDSLALSFGVFIVKDAMKFADFTHAIKPNPVTDVPQAAAAHDTLWDYVANNQESAHMIMWLMSMRGRPRSWRMMEAWPINTFRLINEQGKSTFARFVWKPMLGVHGLLLEEANILGGVDPDYHRNDIIEAIQKGAYPEYELGVQLIAEEDEFKYDFDLLDDTKLWPEEVIPVERIGKMTLNRLVDNFFAEEEQSSFDPSSLVPGIEFTNDPVLQGRSFAYRDTDYHRLGTGSINDIPINRPIAEANYNHRDSYVRHRIDTDFVTYHQNSLADNSGRDSAGRGRIFSLSGAGRGARHESAAERRVRGSLLAGEDVLEQHVDRREGRSDQDLQLSPRKGEEQVGPPADRRHVSERRSGHGIHDRRQHRRRPSEWGPCVHDGEFARSQHSQHVTQRADPESRRADRQWIR